jgi:hypothetical protein
LQKLAIGNGSGATSNTVALIPQGQRRKHQGHHESVFGGATNFVVVRVDHVLGGNDVAYLFVNPDAKRGAVDISAAGAVSSNSFDFSFDRLRVFAGGQSSADAAVCRDWWWTSIVIGESYADVTPYVSGPQQPIAGLVITNVQVARGQHLVGRNLGGSSSGDVSSAGERRSHDCCHQLGDGGDE